MKKVFLLLIMFFMLTIYRLNACIMHFEPKKLELALNKEVTVTVFVELEHRKCDIEIDDTNYDAKGLKIIEKGEWEKIKRNLFKQEIKIKLLKKDGSLRVWRECEKKGISDTCLHCGACLVGK